MYKKKILIVVLFLLFGCVGSLPAQDRVTDSLQKIVQHARHDTSRMEALSELVWTLVYTEPGKAKTYARQELKLAQKTGLPKWTAQGYNDLGIVYYLDGNYDSSLLLHKQALQIRKKFNDPLLEASSLSKISSCYSMKGKYGQAIDYALQALRIYEQQGNQMYQGLMLDNLSEMSGDNLDYDRAMDYSQKAIDIFTKLGDMYYMAKSYYGLANALQGKGEYDKADKYLAQAQQYFEKAGDAKMLSVVFNSMGFGFRARKKDRESLQYYLKAYDIAKKDNDLVGISTYANNLGCVYTDLGEYNLAQKYCLEALAVTDLSSTKELRHIYLQLARIYAFLNQNEKSRHFAEKYILYSDSLYNQQSARQVMEMQVKYETQKKEDANRYLEQQSRLNKAEIETGKQKLSTRNRTIVILVVLILLAGIVVLWWNNALKLKRQKAELALLQKNQREKERISRDLHDHVGGQLSYVLYSLHEISGENEEKREEVVKGISESVRGVVANLRETIWAIQDEAIDMHDFSDKLKLYVRNMFRHTAVKMVFTEKIETTRKLDSTTGLHLFRICQEVVNNAFKHAGASAITIDITVSDKVYINLYDDGKGFDLNQVNTSTYGLSNIRNRATESGIELKIDTAPGTGTRYLFVV